MKGFRNISLLLFIIIVVLYTPIFNISGSVPYIIGFLGFGFLFLIRKLFMGRFSINRQSILEIFVFSLPYLFAFFYTLPTTVNSPFFARSYLSLIYWLSTILIAFFSVKLLNEKAINIMGTACLFVFYLYLVVAISRYGIIKTFTDESILELHELAFALGLYLLFLLFSNKNIDIKRVLFVLIAIMLAFKRIEILAISICFIWRFLIKKIKISPLIYFLMLFLVLNAYFVITYGGLIESITEYFQLDSLGRVEVYNALVESLKKSEIWQGKGLGWVISSLIDIENNYRGYSDIHNDVLKMFIELGILGGVCFWFILIFYNPYHIIKRNKDLFSFVSTIVLYNSILYLTDNTLRYQLVNIFVYQFYFSMMLNSKKSSD